MTNTRKALNMNKKYLNIFVFVFLILYVTSYQTQAMTPTEILENVKNKYTNMKTYHDKGTVKKEMGTVEFETYFVKPSYFLFNWSENIWMFSPKTNQKQMVSATSSLKSNKNETIIYFNYEGMLKKRVEKYSDVKEAIYKITGISWGSAFYIPSFFFPGLNKTKITDLTGPKIVGIQKSGDKEYYQIIGNWMNSNTPYELWIEKDTFLIKKFIQDKTDIYIFDKITVDENIPSHIFDQCCPR